MFFRLLNFSSRGFWAYKFESSQTRVFVLFSTLIFPFYKMLFMNVRLEFRSTTLVETVNWQTLTPFLVFNSARELTFHLQFPIVLRCVRDALAGETLFFSLFFNRGIFWVYCIQHCFICRPSDSTVSEVAGIEPRTVATSALAVRRSNLSARSHLKLCLMYPFLLWSGSLPSTVVSTRVGSWTGSTTWARGSWSPTASRTSTRYRPPPFRSCPFPSV